MLNFQTKAANQHLVKTNGVSRDLIIEFSAHPDAQRLSMDSRLMILGAELVPDTNPIKEIPWVVE